MDFLVPVITVWVFLLLHQNICFRDLYFFGFLSNYQRTLFLLLRSMIVCLYCSKGQCLCILYIVILIIAIDRVSIPRYRIVTIGYIGIVICKFVVFKLSGSIDLIVVVDFRFIGMLGMILFILLISVFSQIFFIFDKRSIIVHIFRLDFDGSYLTLSVTHSLQFEFNITTLITIFLF
jgi:hypothetical protein